MSDSTLPGPPPGARSPPSSACCRTTTGFSGATPTPCSGTPIPGCASSPSPPGSANAVFQGTHDGPNAGLFFIRNSAWSFEFLRAIYQQEQFIHHPWWEQAAIIELLNREDARPHVQVYPLHQRQGGFHSFRIHDDWDSIFIHHASLRGPERLTLIENLVRLAELPPALRLHTRAALGSLLNRLRLLGEGVEIGDAAGDFAKTILDVWEGRQLHLVDAWLPTPGCHDITNVANEEHQKLLGQIPEKLAAHAGRYRVHAMLASEAVGSFPDAGLDFIYLDADKSYGAAKGDRSNL